MSSSSAPRRRYDVFLSFRGEDIRDTFAYYLYKAFIGKGIRTFRDDDEIEPGKQVDAEIKEAIQEAKYSVLIISENYASSSWCLNELLKILESKEKFGQVVYALFYRVDPSDVRKQKGKFGKGFSYAVSKNPKNAQNWKEALEKIADVKGWVYPSPGYGAEANFIEAIVENIYIKLKDTYPCHHQSLVGVASRLEKLIKFLNLGADGTRMVGIWGVGDLGKTTIARAFSMSHAQERFRNIHLQEEYDTHDPRGHRDMVLSFHRRRTKIIEIIAAHDVFFALTKSGICAAFSRETNRRICFLNTSPDEVIRSLFYNKSNDSLITVSVYSQDDFSSLKCRSTRMQYIKWGKLDGGFALFKDESLKWPGFVEFDDVNRKVVTYSPQDRIYKVFDLKTYAQLYSISDKNVQDIKISPGIMLLILNEAPCHVPLKILSIEDGTVLKSFNHLLHRNKKVDFIEQFNGKLLVKQENENLQILDARNSELTEVIRTKFMTPSAFRFLNDGRLFLTFTERTVAVWNFRGELVTSFDNHLLQHSNCNMNNICITSDQDLMISYCKADSIDLLPEANAGSINISNILTGKCLAKIRATNSPIEECDCSRCVSGKSCIFRKHVQASRIRSTVKEALADITAIFYDEERNEIYTGNRHGLVHVWSNRSEDKKNLHLIFSCS